MAEFFTYQKKRKEYGKPCNFSETDIKHCGYYPSNNVQYEYKERNPNFIDLDNILEMSEHSVNTERVKTGEKAMYHKEGGWSDKYDPNEPLETAKFRKKTEKEPAFGQAVKELTSTVESCIRQNNQIDLFEEYFQGEISEHVVENLSSKTLLLFKDDSDQKRSISEISWHPEGPTKIAVSYAIMRFQSMTDKMPCQSYIWDLQNPNQHELALKAPSPITNIAYNQKSPDWIGGGCYNGLLAFWDVRQGGNTSLISPVEKSHFDPITHFQWLMSRTGNECVTTSTDGRVMWWDTKNLDKGPVEVLKLIENPGKEEIVGGTVLEYNVDAGPTKYLVGTEQGSILTVNKKPSRDAEITTRYGLDQGRHLGPVYSINRSLQAAKYFLSVGDWSCKIWVEDLKVPIIRTKYHNAYLSDGCWSPTRSGAFFLARRDGWMDVWDYYYRQNEIAFQHKVADVPLTCLKINVTGGGLHNAGKLVAIGDQDGTVTVLELCESLYTLQPKEKDIIAEMFEREFRKEKNLEALKKQQEIAKKAVPKENQAAKERWENKKGQMIQKVEEQFNEMLKEVEANRQDEELADLDSPGLKKKSDDNKNLDDGGEKQKKPIEKKPSAHQEPQEDQKQQQPIEQQQQQPDTQQQQPQDDQQQPDQAQDQKQDDLNKSTHSAKQSDHQKQKSDHGNDQQKLDQPPQEQDKQ